MSRPHALVLAAIVLTSGCRSDAEKLVDLRTELRTKMDELYAAYGGSSLAQQASSEPRRSDGGDDGGTAARFIGELDRSYFERFCLARGRGERPFNLSGKLEAFMKDAANEKACRDAARLEARIAELDARADR